MPSSGNRSKSDQLVLQCFCIEHTVYTYIQHLKTECEAHSHNGLIWIKHASWISLLAIMLHFKRRFGETENFKIFRWSDLACMKSINPSQWIPVEMLFARRAWVHHPLLSHYSNTSITIQSHIVPFEWVLVCAVCP